MVSTASTERIEHALQVLSSLENMKSREFICDFKVTVENQTFNTHRALLAACSGYFEALFSSNMKEAQDGCITMKDIGMSSIEQCIKYMYTGSCNIEMDSVEGLLKASNLLQIQNLEKKCLNFLKDSLQPDNCLSVLNLARTFNDQDLEKAAEDLIVYNLETVISSDQFLNISKKDLLRFISHANQETSWRAVKTWSKSREEEFEELAERIEFSRLSFKILVNEVVSDPLVNNSQKIRLIVHKSLFSDPGKLETNLDTNNCFRLKKFATDENSKKIIDSFMCKNFSTVVSDPQFCNLNKDEVLHLLKSAEVDSEESKWEAALKWVKHDPKGRKTSFPDLLSSLKLLNLTLKFLEETVRNEEIVKTSMSCMNLLMDAFIKHAKLSTQLKDEESAEASKVDESTICYKQQPPGGEIEQSNGGYWFNLLLSSLVTFKFKSDSYEGIRYRDFSFVCMVPARLRIRVKTAFIERQLFKLKYASGSNRGEVVLGDIPLDLENKPGSVGWGEYIEKLSLELEKKGF